MIWRVPRTIRRRIFWLYVLWLFVLTHWPRLVVRVPGVERPDLIAHLGVFGLLYLLFFAAAYFGPLGSSPARTVARPWIITMVYACIDEALQLIPAIGRHAAWDDLAADILGITLAAIVAALWTWRFSQAKRQESPA